MPAQVGARQHTSVTKQPKSERDGLKATGNEAAENRLRRRNLVYVEGLRIVYEREVNNRALGECYPAALEGISNRQIVKEFTASHAKRIGKRRIARQWRGANACPVRPAVTHMSYSERQP